MRIRPARRNRCKLRAANLRVRVHRVHGRGRPLRPLRERHAQAQACDCNPGAGQPAQNVLVGHGLDDEVGGPDTACERGR
eukprot:2827176-Lingulodinium_polyedra.AAC.1